MQNVCSIESGEFNIAQGGMLDESKKIVWFVCVLLITSSLFSVGNASTLRSIWTFDAQVDSFVALENSFVALSGGEIWICNEDDADTPAIFPTSENRSMQYLVTILSNQLFGLEKSSDGFTIYNIDTTTQRITAAFTIPNHDIPQGHMRKVLGMGEWIVFEFEGNIPLHSDLLLFNAISQETEIVHDCNFSNLAPYEENRVLGFKKAFGTTSSDIIAFDLNTKQTTTLFATPMSAETIAFDASQNQMILLSAPNAIHFTLQGEQVSQRYLPIAYHDSEGRCHAINQDRLFAISDGNRILATPLDETQNIDVLQITSFRADGQETKQFRLSHPETPISTTNMGYDLTPSLIGQMIRSNDIDTDIFMVRTFETGYADLLAKGFCEDLSGNETIDTSVMSMPKALRSALINDGKIYGVPVELELDTWTALACNTMVLEDVGLVCKDIPLNMMELLDQLLAWYQDGTLYDVRLFNFDIDRQAFVTVWYVLNNYTYYANTESEWPDYDTTLFSSLMEKCDLLIAEMQKHSEISNSSPALFDYVLPIDFLSSETNTTHSIIPLTPKANMTQCYPAYMTVAVLNPLSQNKEAALLYLTALAQNPSSQAKLFFWPSLAQPIESPENAENRALVQFEIERLKALLMEEGRSSEQKDTIESQLAEEVLFLNHLEGGDKWELSPDTIEAYQKISDLVFIPDSVIAELLDEQMIKHVEKYAQGQMDSASFINDIVNKSKMMQIESMQ